MKLISKGLTIFFYLFFTNIWKEKYGAMRLKRDIVGVFRKLCICEKFWGVCWQC